MIFARRKLLYKNDLGQLVESLLEISAPKQISEGTYQCDVKFSGIPKYSKSIDGLDEIHALQCAITFSQAIYRNSLNPEFYDLNGESLKFVVE